MRKFISARHLAPGQLVLSPAELDELQQDVGVSVDAVTAHEARAAAEKAERERAAAAAAAMAGSRPQTSPDGAGGGSHAELLGSLGGMQLMGIDMRGGAAAGSGSDESKTGKDKFDGVNQWMLMDHIQTLKHERDQHKRELKKKRTRKAMRDFYDKQVNDKKSREQREHNDWAKYLNEVDKNVKTWKVEEQQKQKQTKQRNADFNRVVMQQVKEGRRRKEAKRQAMKTFEGEGIAIRGPSLIEKIGTREHTLEKDKRKLHRERFEEIQEMADAVKQRREEQRRQDLARDAQIAAKFDEIEATKEEERKKGRKIALAYQQRQTAVLSHAMRDRAQKLSDEEERLIQEEEAALLRAQKEEILKKEKMLSERKRHLRMLAAQVKEKEDARKAEEDFEYSFAKKMFAEDAAEREKQEGLKARQKVMQRSINSALRQQIKEKEQRTGEDSAGTGMTSFERTMNKELLELRSGNAAGAGAAIANLGSSMVTLDEDDLRHIQDELNKRMEATSPLPGGK